MRERWFTSAPLWGRVALGLLLIGGPIAILYAIFQPSVPKPAEPAKRAAAPRLTDSHAVVVLRQAGSERRHRASIACDGARMTASGFWAHDPRGACDALASTRTVLLATPGCDRPFRKGVRLQVQGAFGTRSFTHRVERDVCPSDEPWLGVNALALPVLRPDQKASDPQKR